MADLKLPIALVFAMAVQLVALVWYISNIVHDIEHLQGQISTQQDIIDLLNDDVNDLWVFCTFTENKWAEAYICLLYTSPSPRDGLLSRMPSSA